MTQTPSIDLGGGVVMPVIGFGTSPMKGRRAYDATRHALDSGYRHLDTAAVYRNEAEVGRALRDSGLDRGEVFVTTKLPARDFGKERTTIAESLRALGTDYVDLWLIHWPPRKGSSQQIWEQFIAIKDEGLCRAIGVSNYDVTQIDALIQATGERPVVNQIPWGLSRYDPAVLAGHAERQVVVEGYSPLKNTKLRDRALAEIAARHDVTPAQAVLRWHLQLGIVVIPKSAKPERIESNLDLAGFSLTDEEMSTLSRR